MPGNYCDFPVDWVKDSCRGEVASGCAQPTGYVSAASLGCFDYAVGTCKLSGFASPLRIVARAEDNPSTRKGWISFRPLKKGATTLETNGSDQTTTTERWDEGNGFSALTVSLEIPPDSNEAAEGTMTLRVSLRGRFDAQGKLACARLEGTTATNGETKALDPKEATCVFDSLAQGAAIPLRKVEDIACP